MKRFVEVTDHRFPNSREIIGPMKDGQHGSEVVEAWARRSVHYLCTGEHPACTWRIVEAENVLGAICQSSKHHAETHETQQKTHACLNCAISD